MQRVVFFSGMGADSRAFGLIKLKNVESVFVDWIEPLEKESLQNYAQRLISNVQIKSTDILVGLSLGGFIAQEIASIYPVKKVILLSSLRSGEQLRPLFNAAQKLKLLELVNRDLLKSTITSGAKLIVPKNNKGMQLMVEMLEQYSGAYYKWAMYKVLHWEGANVNCPVNHVHGDKDEIFPISLVKNAEIIVGGRHLMVIERAEEVSSILQKFIDSED